MRGFIGNYRVIKPGVFVSLSFLVFNLSANPAESDFADINLKAKKYLSDLIDINTSQPEGNELEAVRYIYRQLIKENIDWDIIVSDTNRANLIAHLPSAKKNKNKPLILISHLDTVGADEKNWSIPPFEATEKGGYIYGRGATDCKDLTAINLTILLELKKRKIPLERDVILVATADEEAASKKGMEYIFKKYPHKIPKGFALTEGGGIINDTSGKAKIIFLGASEKMNLNLKLIAYGTSAHSSMSIADNAIFRLCDALAKIQNYKPPYRLTAITRRFFEDIYEIQNQDAKTTIDMLLSDDSKKSAEAAEAASENPFFNSQLRDTITPTIISAGSQFNVIPRNAEAILNCRLLYDTNIDEFIGNLKTIINDEKVHIIITEEPRVPFPEPMLLNDELFDAIVKVSKKNMPESIVVGATTSGATDAEFLRRAGIITYGIGSTQGYDSHMSAHGTDEKISLTDFYNQLKFLYLVVLEFAAASKD